MYCQSLIILSKKNSEPFRDADEPHFDWQPSSSILHQNGDISLLFLRSLICRLDMGDQSSVNGTL